MIRLLVKDCHVLVTSLGQVDSRAKAKDAGPYDDDSIILRRRTTRHLVEMLSHFSYNASL